VRPRAKVTIDSLYEVVYEKSIGTKMNDFDLCSYQGHVNHCVTFDVEYLAKPLQIEAWLIQRTANRKCHMEYQMVA